MVGILIVQPDMILRIAIVMKHKLEMAKTIEDAKQRQSVAIYARLGMEFILSMLILLTYKDHNMETMELITIVVIQLVLVQKFGA